MSMGKSRNFNNKTEVRPDTKSPAMQQRKNTYGNSSTTKMDTRVSITTGTEVNKS